MCLSHEHACHALLLVNDLRSVEQFLIIIDCLTDWLQIIQMGQNTATPHLIAVPLDAFDRYGVPDVIWSDQGPQFMSHTFNGFAQEWGFQHITSLPTYPQSIGKAESAAKSMKKMIKGTWTQKYMNTEKLVAMHPVSVQEYPCMP